MNLLVQVKNVTETSSMGKKLLGKRSVAYTANCISSGMVQGKIFSIVGESGCRESTTACLVNHLLTLGSDEVWFDGRQISAMNENQMRSLRGDIQMVLRDLDSSLNPGMRVENSVTKLLPVHTNFSAEEKLRQARELLETVGLSVKHARRYPYEFSDGQRQCIDIAHALTVRPKLIIADEPVPSLDMPIQAQVLNLMQRLQAESQPTHLFILHDLSVVEMISNRIAVMYLGCITGIVPKAELYSSPRHPYTKALPSVIPTPDPAVKRERVLLQGGISSAVHLPEGCLLHAHCPLCTDICRQQIPEPQDLGGEHVVVCHHI